MVFKPKVLNNQVPRPLGLHMSHLVEAKKLEYDRPPDPKTKERSQTTINHPKSVFQRFGVYYTIFYHTNTMPCHTYPTLPYPTLPYPTLPYPTLPYQYHTNTVPIPYPTLPYQYHTIPYHTIPYHTIPYHTIPYHTIPYHTIPYRIITCCSIFDPFSKAELRGLRLGRRLRRAGPAGARGRRLAVARAPGPL